MPGYSTSNRFSLTQLYIEDRKQRAHLKKVSEMQRYSGLDNGTPFRLPYLHQNFLKYLSAKRQEINKENEIKSKKLLNIMSTTNTQSLPSFQPTNRTRRSETFNLLHKSTDYLERIAKTKGNYSARNWREQYEQHKEYLRLSKDNQLFTPLDIGVNRQRIIQANSLMGSKYTSRASSSVNVFYRHNDNG